MPLDRDHGHPADSRVVVRYELHVPDPTTGARFTDVIGMLVEASEAQVVVDSDRGRVIVPRSAVVATRIIPPRPSRRGAPHRALSIEDLERVMVGSWPPVEREHLGDWMLRSAHGFTQRANSALVVGRPGVPLAEALETVSTWYAVRGLVPRLGLPFPSGAGLEEDDVARRALEAAWTPSEPVLVMTAATRTVVAQAVGPGTDGSAGAAHTAGASLPTGAGVVVEVADRMSDAWFGLLSRSRAADRDAADALLHGSPAQRFALARRDGAPIGIARLGISAGWGGIGAMWVDPEHRARGVARQLLGILAQEAAARGCVSLHLQVEASNTAAIPLYETVGFTTHHRYAYLSSAAPDDAAGEAAAEAAPSA